MIQRYCNGCGAELPLKVHGNRTFCSNACRQRFKRECKRGGTKKHMESAVRLCDCGQPAVKTITDHVGLAAAANGNMHGTEVTLYLCDDCLRKEQEQAGLMRGRGEERGPTYLRRRGMA